MKFFNFSRTNIYEPGWRKVYSDRFAGFICPECGKYFIIKFKGLIDIEYPKWFQIKHYNNDDMVPYISTTFHLPCPHCDEFATYTSHDIIDPNIVPTITLLNKKGYETLYSCEGHYVGKRYGKVWSRAYILFSDASLRRIVKTNPLPKSWYLVSSDADYKDDFDDADIENRKLESADFIIRSDVKESTLEIMKDLYVWANSLPNLKD